MLKFFVPFSHLSMVFSFGIIKTQLSRYCLCWSILSSFSSMQSRARTWLLLSPSLSVFRRCLPQHCLFALCGSSFSPLSQPHCQWFRNRNCLWNSLSVFKLYQPSTTSRHVQMPLCLLSSLLPSLAWCLLSSDMPLTNNVSVDRKGGCNSPVLAYQVTVGVHALLGTGMLLACRWLLSSALTCIFAQVVRGASSSSTCKASRSGKCGNIKWSKLWPGWRGLMVYTLGI